MVPCRPVSHLLSWQPWSLVGILGLSLLTGVAPTQAQSVGAPGPSPGLAQQGAPPDPRLLPNPIPPSAPSLPQPDLLPPPENLVPAPVTPEIPNQDPLNIPGTVTVSRFEVVGSTVFSPEQLATVTDPFIGRSLTFAELLQAAAAITQLYIERGYVTSGAFIPANQTFQAQGGVVRIQVLEGSLEAIQVTGTERLDPGYVQSRLAIATGAPLNTNRLLEALQLLQLNPLLRSISAELSAGATPGQSVLTVAVVEAPTFRSELLYENSRSPSIGTDKRQVQVSTSNLSGLGDSLSLAYSNTDGSNGIETSYSLPVSPYNTTVKFSYSTTSSQVIEDPFSILKITAASRAYDLGIRHPILQTPTQDLALGLSFARQESETSLLGIPFPLSAGANDRGQTRISTLRFSQEYTQRGSEDVIALRSQLNFGLDTFGATINERGPDSRFFSWRGQAQYVRLLAPETLLLLRTDLQLADRPLVPLEQIGLGGQVTIRGYRQDFLLSDNGAFASGEVRLPVLRVPEIGGLLQLTSFLDVGTAWNSGNSFTPNPNTLFSGGLGLLWRQGDSLFARLEFGIPFISIPANRKTWQENGLYFSITYVPFTF